MKTLLHTDEIYWDEFTLMGVTTHTPDYAPDALFTSAGKRQVLVQSHNPRNLALLDQFPAYIEEGEADEEGEAREVIRWYYGDECIAASYDLVHHVQGSDEQTDWPVIIDYGWLWETLHEVADDLARSEEI